MKVGKLEAKYGRAQAPVRVCRVWLQTEWPGNGQADGGSGWDGGVVYEMKMYIGTIIWLSRRRVNRRESHVGESGLHAPPREASALHVNLREASLFQSIASRVARIEQHEKAPLLRLSCPAKFTDGVIAR